MAVSKTNFQSFLEEEVNKVKGIYYPVRAGFLRRVFIKHAPCRKLHPNPEDEFCFPEIGPNYEIISRYEHAFRDEVQYRTGRQGSGASEPLMVQKAKPDGYLILNGHHRWAAALRVGLKELKIKTVNLPQVADIRKMLQHSRSDRRVTLDLDEVVFCEDSGTPAEASLRFPLNRFYPEMIRKGVPALLHYFNEHDYDVWVYTSRLCSIEYIRYLFKHRNVRLTGVLTGSGHTTASKADDLQEITDLLNTKYASTIHIDNSMLLRTFSGSKDCDVYPLSGSPETWSREALDAFEKMRRKDENPRK